MVESSGEVEQVLDSIDAAEAERRLSHVERAHQLDPYGDHPQAVAQALSGETPSRPEGMALAEAPMGVIR